jgi:NAD kinase
MKPPRVVLVTRPTDYEGLLARHGTREQARFWLATRGRDLAEVEARHRRVEAALAAAGQAIPTAWRRTRISRPDLVRFVFEPDDLIVAVGQDGLVANVAKYLTGQPVIGVNPDPDWYAGVLVRHRPEATADVLATVAAGRGHTERRTMVEAVLDDGQRLLALNELFLGHQSHQSARYTLRWGAHSERQSSSGLIVTTGTGATGWALSIHRQHAAPAPLPTPEAPALAFYVREPWPSASTGATLVTGALTEADTLEATSEMNEGGTLFGDGLEQDRLLLGWGQGVRIGVARERLALVVG